MTQAASSPAGDGKIKKAEVVKVKELGTIRVSCNHSTAGEEYAKKQGEVNGIGIVSEKASKGRAISHSVE